ncbi:Uncharacterized protein Fot_20113 [Forsythia ovata]|uniref:Uncharacterized protein n=1 Tax=Forsythia ovata TaxID=205694 RepID=A0ABD1VMZ4_9LAMI
MADQANNRCGGSAQNEGWHFRCRHGSPPTEVGIISGVLDRTPVATLLVLDQDQVNLGSKVVVVSDMVGVDPLLLSAAVLVVVETAKKDECLPLANQHPVPLA